MERLSTFVRHIFLPIVLAAVLGSCSEDDSNIQLGGGGGEQGPIVIGQGTERLEVPRMADGDLFISHWSTEKGKNVMTYCLAYDRKKFHSRWVAFRFDNSTRPKTVSRKPYEQRPQYPADPQLPAQYALPDDISFNGYQHGHLCASADRLYSRTANDNTFYLTNMSPQTGNFNSKYWTGFEAFVQGKGRSATFCDTLYVVKGGTIADGQTLRRYVAGGRMPVPKYYFIALLKVKGEAYNAIAFWVEHKDYGNTSPTTERLAAHAVSVDRLEALTGLDFFHNLPDAVEKAVEQRCDLASWGLTTK